MNNIRLNSLLTITVIFVFILSLFSTVNVLADDSTPPPPTEEPALPPTEEPVAETESAPTSTPEADLTSTTPAEILESAPEGVDVVVLDENGESLPLTTEEASQIILSGDPMWCPNGATPNYDPLHQCTIAHPSFSDLISDLETNYLTFSGSGTIYVAYDYDATVAGDAGSDIIFDYDLNGLTDLVIQGGWDFSNDTIFGTSTIALGSGNSLEFWDWGAYGFPASLTINDIILDGGDGLYIGDVYSTTTADVTLNNVDVINTDLGTYIGTDGSVTVTNSNFNDNADTGLTVENNGDINITNSDFSDNGQFSEGRGLIAHSGGNITLANVTANRNGGGGAELINCFFDLFSTNTCLNTNPATITITGINTFSDNGYNPSQFLGGPYASVGLWVGSNGGVTLNGITAQGNGIGNLGGGAFVFTESGNLSISNSNFNFNCVYYCDFVGFGLVAIDLGGDITLNEVTASNNGDTTNASIDFGALVLNLGGNTFVTNSTFSGNCSTADCLGNGIGVLSLGNVYFDHVTANNNGVDYGGGASVNSGGTIDIYCSTFNNNAGYGLSLYGSAITLTGVSMDGNLSGNLDYGSSVLVENPSDCAKTKLPIISLPLNLVNVTSGQSVELDCEHFGGTKLILENGDSTTLPCPITDSASIVNNKVEELPKPLPEGVAFQSAFTTSASKNGEKLDKLNTYATISFMIPDGTDTSKLAILFWNGTEWVEVEGTFVRNDPVTGESYFEVYVNYTGTFALVQK